VRTLRLPVQIIKTLVLISTRLLDCRKNDPSGAVSRKANFFCAPRLCKSWSDGKRRFVSDGKRRFVLTSIPCDFDGLFKIPVIDLVIATSPKVDLVFPQGAANHGKIKQVDLRPGPYVKR